MDEDQIQIAESERVCAEASEAPWWIIHGGEFQLDNIVGARGNVVARDLLPRDSIQIIAARTRWPAALAELRRLRARVAALEHEHGVHPDAVSEGVPDDVLL